MWEKMLVGGFALGVLACSVASGFACMEDSECSLSGEPGVCSGGHCAYPSDTCESGYVYPDGAPGNLAGMCADVEGGKGSMDAGTDAEPGQSTGPGGSGESTDGTTVALDSGTTTSDDTTSTSGSTSLGSSDVTEPEAGEESSSGDCTSIDVVLEPTADAFMTQSCPAAECGLVNHGVTGQHPLGDTENGEQYVIALRFDTAAIFDLGIVAVQSAELELFYNLDGNSIAGTLHVAAMNPEYDWVEGVQAGATAAVGESCWEWAQFQVQQWPEGGPISATTTELGDLGLDDLVGDDTIVIPLDPAELIGEVLTGVDSMLVYGPVDFANLLVFSRESGLSPSLHVVGC